MLFTSKQAQPDTIQEINSIDIVLAYCECLKAFYRQVLKLAKTKKQIWLLSTYLIHEALLQK
jgi:hypothetical protein